MIAGILMFGPGLWLNRLLRITCRQLRTQLLLITTTSISLSALFFWHLYLLGIYTPTLCLAGLLVMAMGGTYGLLGGSIAKRCWTLYDRWRMLPVLDRIGLFLGLLFLQGLFEAAIGTPMLAWDAIVSWDKWAVDMSMRHGLGQYLMGGYPQFLPTLHSVFYKIAGTGGDVFPVEHLLLHGFCVVYVAILMLSLWCLARNLPLPCMIAWLLFVWNKDVFGYLANGYVDIHLTATVSTACALLFSYRAGDWNARPGIVPDATIFLLVLFPVAFTKGNGMIWSLLLAALLLRVSWKQSRFAMGCVSIALVMLSVAPYFLHQFYYSHHADLAERRPFLHAFTLEVAHTSLFTPDGKHANAMVAQLMNVYSAPEAIGIPVVVLCACVCLLALFRLKLAFFSLSGALTLVIWFFTASYDFRNALTAFYVLIIALIGTLLDPDLGKWGNRIRYACFAAFIFTGIFFVPKNRIYKFNSFREAQRYDLVVGERFMGKPIGVVPVAALRRTGRGQTLSAYAPEFHPIGVEIKSVEPMHGSATMPNALLLANQTYLLSIPDVDKRMVDQPRDGGLSIRLDPDDGEVDLRLHPDDAKRDPYAPYFGSVRDGAWIRLIYWMREDGPAYPRFLVKAGNHDVRLASIEWGQ